MSVFKKLLLVISLVALLLGVVLYFTRRAPVVATLLPPTAKPQTKAIVAPSPTPVVTATPSPTAPALDISEVQAAIQKVVTANPSLDIGVSFIRLKDGSRVDVNGDQIFTAASTAKVFIACLALHQVELGKFSLSSVVESQSVQSRIQQMINRSDNDSWLDLMQYVGYGKQLPYAASIGVTSYDYQDNRLAPNDTALVLQKLYTGQLLNKTNTALLLSYMHNTNMEELIPPAVPSGVTFYHKYGDYESNLHDSAIIDDGHEPFVLVIYTSGTQNYIDRYPVFHQIVQAVEAVPGI